MRTTVDLPEGLLERAKRSAQARGTTLSAVVVEALRSALERPPPTRAAAPFELVTFRGRSAWPELDFDRSAELLAAEDELRYRVAEAPSAYRPARAKRTKRKRRQRR